MVLLICPVDAGVASVVAASAATAANPSFKNMGVAPLSFEAPFSNRQSLISGSNAGFSEDPEYPSPICLEFTALLCTWYEETLEFPKRPPIPNGDRQSVVQGKSASVRVNHGGGGIIKKKQKKKLNE